MKGIKYDFDTYDIGTDSTGAVEMAITDNQNAALIALSQVCRITVPELGAQIGSQLQNRRLSSVGSVLASAERMIASDGGRNPSVTFVNTDQLTFTADYGG